MGGTVCLPSLSLLWDREKESKFALFTLGQREREQICSLYFGTERKRANLLCLAKGILRPLSHGAGVPRARVIAINNN